MWILLFIPLVTALDNGLMRTPPMGWMSWATFRCETDCIKNPDSCINEDLYKDMADVMSEMGYLDAGYNRIHVDDCWMANKRAPDGRLVANQTRFPSGIKALTKYMHDRNLYFGIYEDYGTYTCAGYPGSKGHIELDAQTFADWDCDYLKFDGCYSNATEGVVGYPAMAKALNKTRKPIAYSCEWPLYMYIANLTADYKAIAATCNVFRNFDDVDNNWGSISSIIMHYYKHQDEFAAVHGPGQWNDPDMVVAGNKGVNYEESKTQMTVWSIWSAPLILSADLRILNAEYRELLLNREVIAIDQDPLFKMGKVVLITSNSKVFVYTKPITPVAGNETSYAIAFVNMSHKHKKNTKVKLTELGLTSKKGYHFRELWSRKDYGLLKPTDKLKVHALPPTGSMLFKATIVE